MPPLNVALKVSVSSSFLTPSPALAPTHNVPMSTTPSSAMPHTELTCSSPPGMASDDIQPCHLLRLPPELRNAIYELAVVYEESIDLISLPNPSDCGDECTGCIYPGLIRVGGLIGHEASSVFFASNTFVADVCWAHTGRKPKRPSWPLQPAPPPLPPSSGICGLQRAFKRLGRGNCECLHRVDITWNWASRGDASLRAMAAWAAVWATSTGAEKACVPKEEVIRHEYEDFLMPPHPPMPLGTPSGARNLSDSETLRTQLRLEMMRLGQSMQGAEPVDEAKIKARVVSWVMERGDESLEELKQDIRKQWQSKNRHGRFKHKTAHDLMDVAQRHMSPLFKLTPEIRNRIYALILPTDSAVRLTTHHSNHSLILKETDDHLYNSGLRSDPFSIDPLEFSFLGTLPSILRLNHEISAEALPLYLRDTIFSVHLEFDALEIDKLTEFSHEVRALKCTSPLELHIEWLWPQTPVVKSLVNYIQLFNSDGSCVLEPHLRVIHKPAKTMLTRILAELLTGLERLGRTKGRRFGRRSEKLGSRDPSEVFDPFTADVWMEDSMVDWTMDNDGDEDCREAKEMCRDVFRHDIQTRVFGTPKNKAIDNFMEDRPVYSPPPPPPPNDTITYLGSPPASPPPPPYLMPSPVLIPVHAIEREDPFAPRESPDVERSPRQLVNDDAEDVASAQRLDSPARSVVSVEMAERDDDFRSDVVVVPTDNGEAPGAPDDATNDTSNTAPRAPSPPQPFDVRAPRLSLRHPDWLYKGCPYPFEESKGKLEDGGQS